MQRKKLVAGNWKMNGSKSTVTTLLTALLAGIDQLSCTEWLVFPPFVFLEQVSQQLDNSIISWGAQNLAATDDGAFTGEISAAMLKECGCRYVLIGHSERRNLYGETGEILVAKLEQAHKHGLKTIFCVGESLTEREHHLTESVIVQQLETLLQTNLCTETVIAYEPVWAIGTGKTASPQQVQQIHAFIREHIARHNAKIAQQLRIVYGGSVKADNSTALFAMPDVDGGLVGGASLNPKEFLTIGRAAVR